MASIVNTVESWLSGGKDEALSLLKKSYNLTKLSDKSDRQLEFTGLLYDLFYSCLNDQLDPEEIGELCATLNGTLGSDSGFNSLVTDVLAILDAEVACNEKKSQRMAFKGLVRSLVRTVGEDLLKERLDMDTLEMAGLIPSKNTYNQKYVKTKTKLFYKQQKFNLYREESEGYSKLLSELGHERLSDVDPNSVLESIKSLIEIGLHTWRNVVVGKCPDYRGVLNSECPDYDTGRFSLDPNRALDVILEAFERHLEDKAFFVSLLSLYPCEKSTFVNILGFKFQAHQVDNGVGNSDDNATTPLSLYQMTSILLKEGLLQLDSLYPHLSISEEELQEVYKMIMDDASSVLRKANIVSLVEKSDEEKEKEAEALQAQKDRIKRLLSIDVNQKLGLCHACLLQGNWVSAVSLIDRLPSFLPVWSSAMVNALCLLINHTIEPLYRHISPRGTKGSQITSLTAKQCHHNFDDLISLKVFDMLYTLGPKLHSDPLLLCKIIRIGKAYFKETLSHCVSGNATSSLKQEILQKKLVRCFLSVLDEVILPSLSMLQCNCGIAEEVWSMIRMLPYETRYMLFGYWKNTNYSEHPDLMKIKAATINKGRYIMKRLTKDNVKPSGRQIGKLSHNNPGIIFDYVLSQIQKYDNIIIPVVDSLKYLTPIAYDVLAYCVIEALGNPLKERMKHEDTNVSSWLQGLANFCANVFKKYPIDLTGLLQYITNQLKAGKSFDLLVLKEVIQKMAGIEISDEVTASQLEAMAGGELLKVEGGYFSQVRNTKKSSQRLREALVDSNLCLPLFILTAQQRDHILFRDGSKMHLKLVCSMYDHCMDTLVQFGAFLSSYLSPDEYSRRVFDLDLLIKEYRIPGDIAFFLYRPKLSSSIGIKFAELEKSAKSAKSDRKSIVGRQEKNFNAACEEILSPVINAVKPLQPNKVWEEINCKLYVVFWSLTLYDLHVPKERYEEEIGKAKDIISALESNQEMPSSKKKKEQERSEALINRLQEEKRRQDENHQLMLGWLRQEKDSFFIPKVTKNRTLTQFLQLCVFPRCCLTTIDAVYCAKFIQTLHLLETPEFSTLLFLDRTFSDLSYTVSCCTENEVRRYGHFLSQLLEMVSKWHMNKSCYESECAGTPGFISMMRSSNVSDKQYLDFENYRHITFKWHFKLTKSLVICLESKEYIQIRNGLILLTKMLPHYPKVHHLSLALEKRVDKIMEEEKEKRPDLYILAIGYAGMLKSQKPNLLSEQDFHKKNESDSKLLVTKVASKKVEKREDNRSQEHSSSETISTNGVKEESMLEKGKGNKADRSSPLRVPSTAKMELKLTKIDKDDNKTGLTPSTVSVNVTSTIPSNGTKDKKSKTAASTTGTLASSSNSAQSNVSDVKTASSPSKTGQRRPHSATTTTTITTTTTTTTTQSQETSEKEPKRQKIDDVNSKNTSDSKVAAPTDKNKDTITHPKTDKKKSSDSNVSAKNSSTKDASTKDVTSVKVDRKRERPADKEESIKKRKESVDSHHSSPKPTTPSTKATAASSTKSATTPNTKPATTPNTKPATTPNTKPATTPTTKATTPTTKPATTPTTKATTPSSTTAPQSNAKDSTTATENKDSRKRVLKVAKLDKEKTENLKKRTKSPVNEKETSKKHIIKQTAASKK